jgi:hypothetical protein
MLFYLIFILSKLLQVTFVYRNKFYILFNVLIIYGVTFESFNETSFERHVRMLVFLDVHILINV